MTTNHTKKSRRKYYFLTFLSFLLLIGPIGYYVITALLGGALIVEKLALTGSVLAAVALSAIALLNKTVMRSRIFILLFGLYICLDSIVTPLLIIGSCQILDELIITPLRNSAKIDLISNKSLDRRL